MLKIFVLIILPFLLKTERYDYKILFELASKSHLNTSTKYYIPPLIQNWNLSFWMRLVNYSTVGGNFLTNIFIINNNNEISKLEIDIFDLKIFFRNSEIGIMFDPFDDSDMENLKANQTNWFFFSLNYTFKNFEVFLNNSIIYNQTLLFEYTESENTYFNFCDNSVVYLHLIFSHVHFFKFNIPSNDFEEIKYYPKKLLAIYKFSDLKSITNIILNVVNFEDYKSIALKNRKKIPFGKFNAFLDAKINFPFYNRSIVSKNLTFGITGSIYFKNFIKDNEIYKNINWDIKWYTRITQDTLNNISLQTRISYKTISLSEHIINFQTLTTINDLNPDFTTALDHLKNIGNWLRDDYIINIFTIIQIIDIPQPNNQSRSRIFKCEIPVLNYENSENYNFDLSFYDQHYFELNHYNGNLLMYFVLNEILVYMGNNIEKIDNGNKIYFGVDQKILSYCNNGMDLLRSFPNENNKNILNKCIINNNKNKCPDIKNCILCIAGICKYCKANYVKINNECIKCIYPQIYFNNTCNDSNIIDETNFSTFDNDFYNYKIIALYAKVSSLKDNSNSLSEKNTFYSEIYYNKYENPENPSNLLNLIKTEDYELIFNYAIFFNPSSFGKDNTNSVACQNGKKFRYSVTDILRGYCYTNCPVYKNLKINNFCDESLYFCNENENSTNHCKTCKINYDKILMTSGKYICLPKTIETNNITNNQNEIIENFICTDNLCILCSLNGSICYSCETNYKVNNGICEDLVSNCENYINEKCTKCKIEFILIIELNRCIPETSVISECLNYNYNGDQNCNQCNDGFILLGNYLPYECITNFLMVDVQDCENYDENTYECLECLPNHFIFEKLINFEQTKICIKNQYFIENCKDYNKINFLCIECEDNYFFVNGIENNKLCINLEKVINNCLKYNKNSECVEYYSQCSALNKENCPKCKLGLILVNSKCVDICSTEALACDDCLQICPIYLCIKLIPFCLECDNNDFTKCIKCDDNFVLENNFCNQQKKIEVVEESNDCSKGCSQCFNKNCIKCDFDYYFDTKKKVCIKNNKILEKNYDDICLEKDLYCKLNGNLLLKNCQKCNLKCNCKIFYDIEMPFLECENNNVDFKLQENRIYPDYKNLEIKEIKDKKLFFQFKKDFKLEEDYIQIPKKIIYSVKNCSFDNFKFYNIKNKNYSKKIISKTTKTVYQSSLTTISLLPNFITSNMIGFLLLLFQIHEIFSYLYIFEFNGGNLFQFLNSQNYDLTEFNDINKNKFFYEKKFIFNLEKFEKLNFIDFQDIMFIVFYICKEIILFIYFFLKIFYFIIRKKKIKKKQFLQEKLYFLKKRFLIFIDSLIIMFCIKNFSKIKKLFLFHGIFKNPSIEILFIIFNFLIITFMINYLKSQIIYTINIKKNIKREIKIKINKKFCLIKQENLIKEDILLNRMIILNYIIFYFRTYIMQNFGKNLLIQIILGITSLILIVNLLYAIFQKTKIKIIFFFGFFNEILFFIYFIIGSLNFSGMLILNTFYITTYVFDIINTFVTILIIYKLKKKNFEKNFKNRNFNFKARKKSKIYPLEKIRNYSKFYSKPKSKNSNKIYPSVIIEEKQQNLTLEEKKKLLEKKKMELELEINKIEKSQNEIKMEKFLKLEEEKKKEEENFYRRKKSEENLFEDNEEKKIREEIKRLREEIKKKNGFKGLKNEEKILGDGNYESKINEINLFPNYKGKKMIPKINFFSSLRNFLENEEYEDNLKTSRKMNFRNDFENNLKKNFGNKNQNCKSNKILKNENNDMDMKKNYESNKILKYKKKKKISREKISLNKNDEFFENMLSVKNFPNFEKKNNLSQVSKISFSSISNVSDISYLKDDFKKNSKNNFKFSKKEKIKKIINFENNNKNDKEEKVSILIDDLKNNLKKNNRKEKVSILITDFKNDLLNINKNEKKKILQKIFL